jgi:hypothetical protein
VTLHAKGFQVQLSRASHLIASWLRGYKGDAVPRLLFLANGGWTTVAVPLNLPRINHGHWQILEMLRVPRRQRRSVREHNPRNHRVALSSLESALTEKRGRGHGGGSEWDSRSWLSPSSFRSPQAARDRDHREQMPRLRVFTDAEVKSMHKFTLWLAAAILMTGVLTARVSRSAADGPIQGDWSAKFMSGGETACIDLEVERSSWGHRNTWGNTHKISDFVGLDANLATAKDTAVHFELRRDAGIMNFGGRFHDGEGRGKFSFAASAEYVQGMKALGYSDLSQEQIFAFAIHDVSRQFVKDMNDAGYRNLSTDELMAFRIHGVSPEFARAMIELLPEKPSPDNLIAMRIHGVSPEFTKEINTLLGKRFSADELVAFRIHGVSPDFVREVRETVSKDVSADDLVAMRIHGASPEFVKSMSSLLGRKLPVEQLVAFRIHGVSPEFTEDIQKLVEKNISSDDLVAFRIHGVSPEFVRSMKDAGYSNISPDQLVAMRIHGVDANFVKEVRAHGYKDPTIDDLIELRIHGRRHRESL